MKNKRGLTLVELIVSIALISMIMVFLMKLLNEIKYQEINSNTKIEYKTAANMLIKSAESMIGVEKPARNGLSTCTDSLSCYKVLFQSGNYLKLFISDDKKKISIIKYDSNGNILTQEVKQTPEKVGNEYLGKYDDLNYNNSVLLPTDFAYNYENDSLLTLSFNIYDSNNQTYLVKIYIVCENINKQVYTIKYDCNGGTDGAANSNHVYGIASPLTINTCYYVLGYKDALDGKGMIAYFTGWSTTPTGEMEYEDGDIISDLATSGEVTLYAVWENAFSYNNSFKVENDGEGVWRLKFLDDGNFIPSRSITIDAFLVGGGGAGCSMSYDNSGNYGGNGGGGGYTATYLNIPLIAGTTYPIDIGAGGVVSNCSPSGGAGKPTTAFGKSRSGGEGGNAWADDGGDGGSGGGGGYGFAGVGGKNGGPGKSLWGDGGTGQSPEAAGTGQNRTTCEFDQGITNAATCRTTAITMYAGGGGGRNAAGGAGGGGRNAVSGYSGQQNTGGGGGGTNTYNGGTGAGNGGSGIVVIRPHQE